MLSTQIKIDVEDFVNIGFDACFYIRKELKDAISNAERHSATLLTDIRESISETYQSLVKVSPANFKSSKFEDELKKLDEIIKCKKEEKQ
jgi:hypothetical protein